jgi:hypothetical protein
LKKWYPPSLQDCALCRAPAQDALCGNRLLSRWEIRHLPTDLAEAVSWPCERHQDSKLQPASTVHANAQGDLIFSLVCGHQVHWVCRGQARYTPALVASDLATGRIRLDRLQRCYVCSDLERAREKPDERDP